MLYGFVYSFLSSKTIRSKTIDTGEGRFERINSMKNLLEMREKYPKSKGIFTAGEELEIRGSRFRVKAINPFEIKLRLSKK